MHNKSTKYEVTVGFAQELDENGVDVGYNQTTGLIVLGANLPPGQSARVDVSAMKVRATRAELSLDCKNKETGEQVAIDLPDHNAGAIFPYMLFAEWELRD